MSLTDLITFFTEEAWNRYLEDQQASQAKSVPYVHKSKQKKSKGCKEGKSGKKCGNCGKDGHTKPNCYQKGGGKEGQAPWQKKGKKDNKKGEKKTEETANTAQDEEFFTFTCTSDFSTVAEALQIPKLKRGAIIDSGASQHFCPDWSKFTNYKPIENSHPINTVDGRTFEAIGMG